MSFGHNHKVIMVSADPSLLDVESASYARHREYAKSFKELHIIVLAQRGSIDQIELVLASNAWIYSTSSYHKIFRPFDAIRLARLIAHHRQITHVTTQDPFETGLVGYSLKKRLGLSLEIQIHTDLGNPAFASISVINRIRVLISELTLRVADHIRVVSDKTRKYLIARGLSAESIELKPIDISIPNIDPEHVNLLRNNILKTFPHCKKIFVSVARLEKEKNITFALDVFAEIYKKRKDIVYIVVGDGSLRPRLEKYARKLNIIDRVVFTGTQRGIDYISIADLVMIPSLFEGYGLVFKEAEALGKNIISADVGIAHETKAHVLSLSKDMWAEYILHRIL